MNIRDAQAHMQSAGIDGWLLYDFRNSNPIFWHVLGATKHSTRRNLLWIPRDGAPQLLAHAIDADLFAGFTFPVTRYVGWQDLHSHLRSIVSGAGRIAMEYSPGAAIPIVSYVDAGTIELIRSFGAEVVSSAGLFQDAAARWDDAAYQSHMTACRLVNESKDAAFQFISQSTSAGRSLTEYDVQQFIMQQFAQKKLETDDPPIVAVNQNSGDPHYQPTAARSNPILRGDWVLIDLWAKLPGERNVFADITWTGVVAPAPQPRHAEIFGIVTRARNAAVQALRDAWQARQTLMGWQVDRVTRGVIEQAGYADRFFHRTGHSMGPGNNVHALGVNLDDLETHDTRKIVPAVGFSVEPGIYLPEFGVRSEIDVYMHPKDGPKVTTPMQDQIICMNV